MSDRVRLHQHPSALMEEHAAGSRIRWRCCRRARWPSATAASSSRCPASDPMASSAAAFSCTPGCRAAHVAAMLSCSKASYSSASHGRHWIDYTECAGVTQLRFVSDVKSAAAGLFLTSARYHRPQVPFQQWDSQQTTVCVTLEGAQVQDIWGTPFPGAKNCTTVDHRRARDCSHAVFQSTDSARGGETHMVERRHQTPQNFLLMCYSMSLRESSNVQDHTKLRHAHVTANVCVQAARRAAVADAAVQRRRGPRDRRPAGGAGGGVHGAGDGPHRCELRVRRAAGHRHRQRPPARALPCPLQCSIVSSSTCNSCGHSRAARLGSRYMMLCARP